MEKQTGNERIFCLSGRPSGARLPNLLNNLIFLCCLLPACTKSPTGVGESLEAGCNIHTLVQVKSSGNIPPSGLDIFVFRDGAVKSLDSYSRVQSAGLGVASVISGSGDRIVAMIGGIMIFSLMTAIISSAYVSRLNRENREDLESKIDDLARNVDELNRKIDELNRKIE